MPQSSCVQRKSVSSSNLCSVGYDGWTGTLEIEFHSGAIYRYSDVPEERYQRLMESTSKGSYFHNQIKHSFAYRRVA